MDFFANLYPLFGTTILVFGIVFAIFLYWRSGRHELIDSSVLLDRLLVALAGGLIFARLFHFFARADIYEYVPLRIIFLNTYWGLDFFGFLFGVSLASFIIFRKSKESFLIPIDLAVAPLAFAQAIFYISKLFGEVTSLYFALPTFVNFVGVNVIVVSLELVLAFGYFILFFILKRLSSKKRFDGYFASVYLIGFCLILIGSNLLEGDVGILANLNYENLIPFVLLVFGVVVYYILAKRKPRDDLKRVFAFVLLIMFKVKNIFTSVEEAGKFSKSILFLPYFLITFAWSVLGVLVKEIMLGFLDFMRAFKIRK